MDGSGRYILDGHTPVPCDDLMTWGLWLEKTMESRRVARDRVGGTLVSTVFLALDHNFSPDGPPILFETMVFPDEKAETLIESEMDRYSTWEEAEAGHAAMVAKVRKDLQERGAPEGPGADSMVEAGRRGTPVAPPAPAVKEEAG